MRREMSLRLERKSSSPDRSPRTSVRAVDQGRESNVFSDGGATKGKKFEKRRGDIKA